ncbi:Argininosuccinate lyase [hydrothermal vent metagenome]|uniref:Argininosuccinate lyase n=1 Tax=hydrothermal vent metagenome TaxID=652676 RepID=A0A3B1CGL6_9ZZZZ
MKKKKAWSGRFNEPTHPLVEIFNASIWFDWRLYKHDIRGSIAHVSMLAAKKIITKKDAGAIVTGLKRIGKEIDSGKFDFDTADEDIHMAIERRLAKIIGPIAGKLHTARSRNDQVATDLRLFVRDCIDEIAELIRSLQKAFYKQAVKHIDTIAPSYTHLQPAQPIRLAHWFLAYYEMLDRDVARFVDARKRVNVMPLGSAALTGTNFPIDRKMVADELDFDSISENSLDAVSDRDFAAEFLFAVSMTATHLSRLAEELVIFTSAEFSVMELPDAFCTGSSIMPQKKNPDVPELIRGKTGRLNGNLLALLTTLKGLPLAYNKDMQEDKEPVFSSYEQIAIILEITADMVGAIKVDKKLLEKRANENFMASVDIADKLAMAGVPFREAHEIVGQLVRLCLDNGWSFCDIPKKEAGELDRRLVKALDDTRSAAKSADGKDIPGGTARKRVAARLKKIEKGMKKW